jgi:general secretion pathway protein H
MILQDRAMKRCRGFTLLEILLVLFVISMSAMVVVMSLPGHSQQRAQRTVDRLYQRMQLLSEDAIYSGRNYGLYVDEKNHRFRFLMLTDKGWEPLKIPDFTDVVSVERDIHFRFDSGGSIWGDQERLFQPGSLFDSMGFPEEEKQEEKQKVKPPQVIVFNSGEMTAFTILLWQDSTPNKQWSISTSSNGLLQLKTPEEVSHDKK